VRDVFPDSPDFVRQIHTADPAIVYVCSPNNPTGGVLPLEVIERIAAGTSAIVMVDEAYIDFGGQSAVPILGERDNLIVTRTFSKAFGLAGLRVGYAIAPPRIVSQVEAARGPYKVSGIAERAAIAALQNDRGWVAETVAKTITNRGRFSQALAELGFEPLESEANFLLVPVNDSTALSAFLRSRGIGVRAFRGLAGIGDAVRITVGPWEMMSECIAALREVVS
jgi:histidinol-phosphate aminotransferase